MARASFKFRLQRLLDVRIIREKQAQQELLARKGQLAVEEQRLVTLQEEEAALKRAMVPQPGQPLDIEMLPRYGWAIDNKRKEQQQQRSRIAQAEQRVREQEGVVRQAGIDVKALEKLREKKHEEFREEQLREEAVFLDDLASQQFIRQQVQAQQLAEELAEQLAQELGDSMSEDLTAELAEVLAPLEEDVIEEATP